jgi:hypothetical protein
VPASNVLLVASATAYLRPPEPRKRTFVMAFETPVTDAGKSEVHRIDQGLATSAFFGPGNALENGSFQKCAVPVIATMALQGAAP